MVGYVFHINIYMKYFVVLLVGLLIISFTPYMIPIDQNSVNQSSAVINSINSRMNSTVYSMNFGTGNSSYSRGLWNLTDKSVATVPQNNTSVFISSTLSKSGTYIFKPGSTISSTGIVGKNESLTNLTGWTSQNSFNFLLNGGNWTFNFYLNVSATTTGGIGYAGVAAYLYNSTSGNAVRFLISQNNSNIFSLSPGTYSFVGISPNLASINGTGKYLIIEPFVNITSVPTLITSLATTTTLSSLNIYFGIGTREGSGSNLSYPFYGNLNGTVSPLLSTVLVDGVQVPTHSGTFNRTLFPGNYNVSITSPYYANFTEKIIVESGHVVSIDAVLKKLYNLTVTVSGLSPNTSWNLSVNGTGYVLKNTTFSTQVVNGSYSLNVPGFIYVSKLERYYAQFHNHTLNINGSSQNYTFKYEKEYYLNVNSNSISRGNVTPISAWYPAGSMVNISEKSYTGFTFRLWTGTGNGSYSGPNGTGTIIMNSPVNETAWFYPLGIVLYKIYFDELGLPSGTYWTVSLNNTPQQSNSSQMYFEEPNGTYSYEIYHANGYVSNRSYGNVSVNGSSSIITLSFSKPEFLVQFVESGLPSSLFPWIVSIQNFTNSSRNNTIQLYLENGTYKYSVYNVTGYSITPHSGYIMVNGSGAIQLISFSLIFYNITFINEDYSNNSFWGVVIYNSTGKALYEANNSKYLTIQLPAGEYNYSAFEGNNIRTSNASLFPQLQSGPILIAFNAPAKPPFSVYMFLQYPLVLLFPIIIIAALISYLYLRRKLKSWDDEFIIYHDGRLLRHYTRRMNPDVDQDLLSASLMAIQNAIKEASGTRKLDYINIKGAGINIINGRYISVALMGKKEIRRRANLKIRRAIKKLEAENRAALIKWKGDQASLKWIDKYRDSLRP